MADAQPPASCPLCAAAGGVPVWQDADWRVIRVDEAGTAADFPAFYRVVAQRHVAEFSDLDAAAQARCIALVTAVERVLRAELKPIKINLAALGNVVPHLHWHVIARFDWDSHFPNPVWGARLREPRPPAGQQLAQPVETLDERIRAALAVA